MLFCLLLAVLFSFIGPGTLLQLFLLLRPCLHCPVRGTGAATLRKPLTFCEAWCPRASRLSSRTLPGRAVWSLHTGGVPWRQPHSAAVRRTPATRVTMLRSRLQQSLHLLTKCLLVGGHLSTSFALLIDRSAKIVESSLSLWQTLAPPHAGARLTRPSCCRRVSLSFSSAHTADSSRTCHPGSLPFAISLLTQAVLYKYHYAPWFSWSSMRQTRWSPAHTQEHLNLVSCTWRHSSHTSHQKTSEASPDHVAVSRH